MKLSVVIPCHNEEGSIVTTLQTLGAELHRIPHEIIVVNDNSTDRSVEVIEQYQKSNSSVRLVHNSPPNGFGLAVRKGLEHLQGDCVAIMMADLSDDPKDLLKFYQTMLDKRVDCVFGTRFHPEAKLYDYPVLKLILNRTANNMIRLLFGLKYNDVTNAFKCYRKEVIQGLKPFLSHHFNLTVELPLKAIIRGYSYTVVPNSWTNRVAGVSKLKIKEMGSRYLFIILYCWLEKWLSRGDYHSRKRF